MAGDKTGTFHVHNSRPTRRQVVELKQRIADLEAALEAARIRELAGVVYDGINPLGKDDPDGVPEPGKLFAVTFETVKQHNALIAAALEGAPRPHG